MSDRPAYRRPKRSYTCTCGGRTIPGKGLCLRCLEREVRLDRVLCPVKLEEDARTVRLMKQAQSHEAAMREAREEIDRAAEEARKAARNAKLDEEIRALYPEKHTPPLPFGGAKEKRRDANPTTASTTASTGPTKGQPGRPGRPKPGTRNRKAD